MSLALLLDWSLNHLWQSTLFAVLAGALTLLFRRNNAAVRYNIWLIASLKFLVPFSLLIALGNSIGWNPAPVTEPPRMSPIDGPTAARSSEQAPTAASVIKGFVEPLPLIAPVTASASGFTLSNRWPSIVTLIFAVWLAGLLIHLFSWFRQWLSIRAKLRAATPLELDVPALIPALSSPTSIEPSVFGILRPVLLMPERITEELNSSQIESILLHESAHVNRRDNLGAALHMVVESLFWFHPMVWWIRKRMS
jgi:beta-lactamase regulating signal transducer with metallopeptidase domain